MAHELESMKDEIREWWLDVLENKQQKKKLRMTNEKLKLLPGIGNCR